MILPSDITDEDVVAIEEAVGMGTGAWDCIPPKEIIVAVLNQLCKIDENKS